MFVKCKKIMQKKVTLVPFFLGGGIDDLAPQTWGTKDLLLDLSLIYESWCTSMKWQILKFSHLSFVRVFVLIWHYSHLERKRKKEKKEKENFSSHCFRASCWWYLPAHIQHPWKNPKGFVWIRLQIRTSQILVKKVLDMETIAYPWQRQMIKSDVGTRKIC